MECRYCGGKITSEDPLFPKIHYRCANRAYKDLERFKIIRVVKKQGTLVQGEIRNSFLNLLNQEMKAIQSHAITDDSVNEDILELQAVVKGVMTRVPRQTSQNKLAVYCELVFNAIMINMGAHCQRTRNSTLGSKNLPRRSTLSKLARHSSTS